MVDDGVEEGLGFPGTGAGGHQGGLRPSVAAAETGEGLGLVGVGPEARRQPAERCPPRISPEGHAGLEIRALEHARVLVSEERPQSTAGSGLSEREGGCEIVQDALAQTLRLRARQQLTHRWFLLTSAGEEHIEGVRRRGSCRA